MTFDEFDLEGHFAPLPAGFAQTPIKSGKFFDIEVLGEISAVDLVSANWDGGADLSGGRDATATEGYLLDASAGAAQYQEIYAEGGELNNLDIRGDLTFIASGGRLLTAASGSRFELTSFNPADTTKMFLYSGGAEEVTEGELSIAYASSVAAVTLGSPEMGDDALNHGEGYVSLVGDASADVGKANLVGYADGTFTAEAGVYAIALDADAVVTLEASGDGHEATITLFADESLSATSITFSADQVLFPDGAISAPAIAIESDLDSGFYYQASGEWRWASNGDRIVTLKNAGMDLYGDLTITTTGTHIRLDNDGGTQFHGDFLMKQESGGQGRIGHYDSGSWQEYIIWRENEIRMGIFGSDEFFLTSSLLTVPNVYNTTTSSSANVQVHTNGVIRRSTSSRRYKEEITYDVSRLLAADLRAAHFYSPADEDWFWGLIAEEVAEAIPGAAIYGKSGLVRNYEDRAVLAWAVAQINELKENRCHCSM